MDSNAKENLLIHGSFADLLHDFGEIVSKKDARNNKNFIKDVYDGLPNGHQDPLILNNPAELLDSEEQFLQRIFPIGDTFVPNANSPKPLGMSPSFAIGNNKDAPDYYSNLQDLVDHTFTNINGTKDQITSDTFNGDRYIITQSVVIKKKNSLMNRILGDKYEYNPPFEILQKLGIQDHSAFVVDFAAVSLPDFLTAPDRIPRAPLINLYFITNPETENDAAGKTSPTSEFYYNINPNDHINNGVHIISLQQSESVTQTANYKWTTDADTAYEQFFTKYTFSISDLIKVDDKKRVKYKTNLIITSNEDPSSPESISDSGNASNITFVKTSIFKRIKNLFLKKDPKDVFFINSKFQHKRSGDWLQVLSCVNLKDRAYKQFRDKAGSVEESFNPSIISDVYFVTHDRIALGFALYLGLNAVYTHAATSAYYVFRNEKNVGTQAQRDAREAILNEQKYRLASIIFGDKDIFNGKIIQTKEDIIKYNRFYSEVKNNLEYNIIAITNSYIDYSNITQKLIEIFILLNRYVMFLNKYQLIDDDKFETITTNYNQSMQMVIEEQERQAQQAEQERQAQQAPPAPPPAIDIDIIKKLINTHNQCKYENDKIIQKFNKVPEIIPDEVYETLMSNWNFDYTLRSFNSPSKRHNGSEKEYLKNLSNIKFNNKNPNPFAVIWTDTLNRLPDNIKMKIHDFIIGINRIFIDPFNPESGRTDSDKKIFIIYKKLLSELLVKFNYDITIPIESVGGKAPYLQITMEPLNRKSMYEMEPLNRKSIHETNPYDLSKPYDLSTPYDLSNTTNYSQLLDEKISGNLENMVISSNAPSLHNPDEPYYIQINVENVINEYMAYLSYIYPDSYRAKTNSSSTKKYKSIGTPLSDVYVGGAKKNTTKKKPHALLFKTKGNTMKNTIKKNTIKKSRKPVTNLRKTRTNVHIALRNTSKDNKVDIKVDIKVHELFTEHTYILLNHILLKSYDQLEDILHPMLPIFMLSEALSIIFDLNDDDEIREDYYYYYKFLTNIYSHIKNVLPRVDYRYFGLFLRELLFYNIIPINNKSFSSITHQLTNYISGNIIPLVPIYTYNEYYVLINRIIIDTYRSPYIPKMNFIKKQIISFKFLIKEEFNTSS